MDIDTCPHKLCTLEKLGHGETNVKVGSGHCFVVLGVRVRVLTMIIGRHSNANFVWTSMMFVLIKGKYSLIFM